MKHLQQGDVDLIVCEPLHDGDPASPLTGLATVVLRIYRASDRWFFDFNDSTFKASGHTTIAQTMTQLDATNAPGVYYYAWTTPAADETYHYLVDETGGSAKNVPQPGEVYVGSWVDDIDQALSTTEANIRGTDGDDLKDISDEIAGLENLSQAEAQAAAAAALTAYDPPTKAELDTTEANLTTEHGATQAAVAALNDLDQADVQAALTAQGYTAARAPALDNLDVAVSSRSSHDAAAVDTQLSGVHGAGSWEGADVQAGLDAQGYTSARAGNLDNLDAAVSSRSSHDAAAVDTQLSGTHGAGSWEGASGLTAQNVRDAMKLAPSGGAPSAGSVDQHLDDIETAAQATQGAVAALNDLSQAEAQAACDAALTAYGAATAGDVSTAETNILAAIAGLNDLDSTAAQAACAAALTAFDCATETNVSAQGAAVLAAVAALENLSQAQAQAACAAALAALNFDAATGTNIQWLYDRWFNKLELSPTGRWELFDDAGSSVIAYWDPVTDRNSDPIVLPVGAPANRPSVVIV